MQVLTPLKFGLLLMAGALVTTGLHAAHETEDPVDFVLERLDGGSSCLSDFRGQWVVLNYWATWCEPCRKEIPELSELHEARGDITVLGLAFEDAEQSDFEAFLGEFHPAYPILLVDVYDPPEPFGAPRVLPTTIVLEPGGRPVRTFAGPVTRTQVEDFIQSHARHE
jgi:thiol-disulfide isomerase/thioredoxin